MRVVVEAVGLVPAFDVALHAVNRHVHKAQLGVVVHFLLPVEHHGLRRVSALLAHVVACRYEHATAAAGWVQHGAAHRLDHIHDHAHERLGGKEHAVVACHGGRELAQEVLVYASDDVVALFIECRVVENADNACQKFVAKLGISVR